MADVGEGLKKKYGLSSTPNDVQIKDWYQQTERLIRQGLNNDNAAEQAAKIYLPGYRSQTTKSDADTLQALLEAAKKKTSG